MKVLLLILMLVNYFVPSISDVMLINSLLQIQPVKHLQIQNTSLVMQLMELHVTTLNNPLSKPSLNIQENVLEQTTQRLLCSKLRVP